MGALLKTKKIKKFDYSDLTNLGDKYQENVMLGIASEFINPKNDSFLVPLANEVTKKTFAKATDFVGKKVFIIDDGKVRIDVALVMTVYNTELHSSVSYYSVSTSVRNGNDVDHDTKFSLDCPWSQERAQVLYEAIDDILSEIIELGSKAYNEAWARLDEADKSKK